MKVLVTGCNGYIGSLLVPLLKDAGHFVVGMDIGYFDDPECQFKKSEEPNRFIKKDVRDIAEGDLHGIDAVCHLAALSNDPMGALNPQLTREINLKGSKRVAMRAKAAGVQRFIFSSSCSVYGALGDKEITEETPTDPKTEYAISKVEFEKILLALADDRFSPAILRNATAYGSSPKLRLDLVLNNFAANAYTKGEIRILSDGSPWRPMIHAEDIARLFVALLEAPREKVHGQIINAGQNVENFQVKQIAEIVRMAFPNVQLSFAAKPDTDSRTYRVSFDKLVHVLPNFRFRWTLGKAAEQLRDDFAAHGLPNNATQGRNYMRLQQIKYLKAEKKLGSNLTWLD